MIPHAQFLELLTETQHHTHTHGAITWTRFADWVKEQRVSSDSTRGGGLREAESDVAIKERIDDHQASRYHTELSRLTDRITADLHRLQTLIRIANPDTPRQEIGAGCQSCYRDAGRYEPIHLGRYKRACRWCGEWRAEHGDWPPLAVIRWRGRNPGKRVPVSIIEQAS